ncbi:hypothetical protein EPZ47_03570 [Pseudomonas viciae]|uniref:Uncharacterized protein n=1 Tax=Pseudomonas viciae TaxID=2505979 RepID=A0A4P7PCW0_9PSED|nr:hypothetical protein EPZ47_03570 [Pseudomonas viciae]
MFIGLSWALVFGLKSCHILRVPLFQQEANNFVGATAAFASKPAPTGDCISNVGAGLLAKAPDQPPQNPGTGSHCPCTSTSPTCAST